MEEEFYATIKLTSGEEIIAKVSYDSDDDVIITFNPLLVEQINSKKIEGFKLKKWIHATHEDMFIISRNQIVTMIETEHSISKYYEDILNLIRNNNNIEIDKTSPRSQEGFLASTKEAKITLEDIYNKS